MRFVFVHNHIFKNAGSTIDDLFERAGFHNTRLEATQSHPVVRTAHVLRALDADPAIEYVSSHSFQVPRPPDTDDIGFVDITFLRHPIDRLHSIYRYTRHPAVADFPMIDKSADFATFVDALLEHAPAHVHSPQTVCLGNDRNFHYPPGSAELDRAMRTVAATRFLGVVDLFDDSVHTFVACCRALMEGKDLSVFAGPFSAVNRSGGEAALEQRLESIGRALGPERLRFVEAANAADLELYRMGRDEVLRRRALVIARGPVPAPP